MKHSFSQKRIPTLLGLILVMAGILTTSYLVQRSTSYLSHAAPDPTPHAVQIANVSDSSLTVTFETFEPTVAAVNVQGRTNGLVFDDRSGNNSTKAYYSHIFTIKNLSPNSPYSFTIVSNGQTYNDNGKDYTAKTASSLAPQKNNKPFSIQGTIILPNGEKGKDTLVTAVIGNSQLLAGITNDNGEYTLNPSFLLDSSLKKYVSASASGTLTLHAYQQDMQSTIKVLPQDSATIPIVTLSKDYDFTVPFSVSSISTATPEAGFQIPEATNTSSSVLILSPAEGGTLIDQQPLFRGTAPPNESVTIIIHSDAGITTTVTTDANGNWSFRPARPLSTGSHSITISARTIAGILKTVSRSFSIFASGTQVAESATPSATPTLTPTTTPTSTPTPTPTATQTPTPSPTVAPTTPPTATPTLVPTSTLTPTGVPITVTGTPTIRPTLAPTGSNSYLVLTFVAVAFIFAGATILFLL